MDIGPFRANETVLFCPYHNQTSIRSDQLRKLTPERGTFGFDVIVEVGLELFVHCHNNQEVMKTLAAKNVFVSEREISYLGRKFIIYLALAHRNAQYQIRKLMAKKGGYILHVDGTCEGDSPNLFCGLDGISELVLDRIKIPSEKKELLVPFFQGIKRQYGEPIALVHDMGRGIIAAVEEVFPGKPDFICHFHFLRDIGKDLLLEDYTALQKRLRELKARPQLRQRSKYLEGKINPVSQTIEEIVASIEVGQWRASSPSEVPFIMTYALINWVFEYPRQSGGYGFPFDRPHLDFFHRLQKVHELLWEIMRTHPGDDKDNKPYLLFYKAFKKIVEDEQLNSLASKLVRKAKVFDQLRTAMRIALPDEKNGINDGGADADMKSIEKKVTAFKKWLLSDTLRVVSYSDMITQLDKYWDKLFADPLSVITSEGIHNYVQPQRTNNILERFFRGEKQRARKKTGTSSLSKFLKSALAETPLVQNLRNNEYLKIILNGCSSLADRFSQIDTNLVQQELAKAKNNKEKILPTIKKLITDINLTTKIFTLYSSCRNINANRHLRS